MINNLKNIVVISPHPDDETLGLGGSIKKFSSLGINVHILVVSGHLPPLLNDKKQFLITKEEAIKAFNNLGVTSFKFY